MIKTRYINPKLDFRNKFNVTVEGLQDKLVLSVKPANIQHISITKAADKDTEYPAV